MKKHKTLAEAHEALRRLRENEDEMPKVHEMCPKKGDRQAARQMSERVDAT